MTRLLMPCTNPHLHHDLHDDLHLQGKKHYASLKDTRPDHSWVLMESDGSVSPKEVDVASAVIQVCGVRDVVI